jgi:hypothetical protein
VSIIYLYKGREVDKLRILQETIDFFQREAAPQDKLMFVTLHGSYLYGTNTIDSDIDVKGIYIPSINNMLLGKAKDQYSFAPVKSKDEKNKANDLEITIYSIQKFMHMLSEGETIAMDMIHSNDVTHAYLYGDLPWLLIRSKRNEFYTKNMKAFLGYCKKQANKYGVKGSRLAALRTTYEFIHSVPSHGFGGALIDGKPVDRYLSIEWNNLPINEHCFMVRRPEMEYYSVLGSLYQPTMRIEEFKRLLTAKWNEYGERARLAMQNEGVDWKAMSHALRAAYQLKQIYVIGDLKYPLGNADFLLSVKRGERPFSEVSELLDEIIKEVEGLAENSEFPDKVDPLLVEQLILNAYKERLRFYR